MPQSDFFHVPILLSACFHETCCCRVSSFIYTLITRYYVLHAIMAFLFFVFVPFIWSRSVDAFSAFQPNCSTPPTIQNYVASPQVRGTMDIVWSCFSVLVLCIWSVQHLAVPVPEEESKRQSYLRRFALSAFRVYAKLFKLEHKNRQEVLWHDFLDEVRWNINKLVWMEVSLIAPEYVLGKALQENLAANDSRKATSDDEWTTMHAFFANMRGLVMRFETTAVKTSLEFAPKSDPRHRDLNKPRPGGYPTPYFEQDAQKAEEKEREDCNIEDCTACKYPHERDDVENQQPSPPPSSASEGRVIKQSPNSRDKQTENDPEQRPTVATIDTSGSQKQHAGLDRSPLPATASTLVNDPRLTPLTTQGHSFTSRSTPNSSPETPQNHIRSLTSKSPTAPCPQKSTNCRSLHSPSPTISKGRLPQSPTCPPSQPRTPQVPPLRPHKAWTGIWPLSTIQLQYACSVKLIPSPPYLASDELKNQSKSDALVKALAIWQITWLVVQIIARAFASPPLATTQVEITVCAYAACAILTYILLWHKPQDVKVPTYIDALRPITREDVIALAARAPLSTMNSNEFWLHGVAVKGMSDNVFPFTRGLKVPKKISSFLTKSSNKKKSVAPSSSPSSSSSPPPHQSNEKPQTQKADEEADALYLSPVLVGIGLSGTIFGGIHFAAWSFQFPSAIERLLWRIGCCILVGFPMAMTALYCGYTHYSRVEGSTKESRANNVLRRFGYLTIPIYLLARIYLMVEVFRSLAYSEPSIFAEVNWPSAIPHYS